MRKCAKEIWNQFLDRIMAIILLPIIVFLLLQSNLYDVLKFAIFTIACVATLVFNDIFYLLKVRPDRFARYHKSKY